MAFNLVSQPIPFLDLTFMQKKNELLFYLGVKTAMLANKSHTKTDQKSKKCRDKMSTWPRTMDKKNAPKI